MEEHRSDPVVREHGRRLDEASRAVQAELPLERLVAEIDRLAGPAAGLLEPPPAARAVAAARARHGAAAAGAYAQRLVLRLIEDQPARLQRIALTDAVRSLYPGWLERIARGLVAADPEAYIAPHAEVGVSAPGRADFWRDLRIAAQLAVPVTGSRALDLGSHLTRSFYRGLGARENLRALRFLVLRLGGLGPLFRMHIDERNPVELDEAGYDRAYLRVAELLRLYPKVKGSVSISWTLDPKLDGISPTRAYGRRTCTAHGAFLHYEGPSELATRRALKRSPTRRRLYEAGAYVPTNYSVVWPRRDLLRWAESRALG
jgi:hypothetical protein